jgi:hypothetical protein
MRPASKKVAEPVSPLGVWPLLVPLCNRFRRWSSPARAVRQKQSTSMPRAAEPILFRGHARRLGLSVVRVVLVKFAVKRSQVQKRTPPPEYDPILIQAPKPRVTTRTYPKKFAHLLLDSLPPGTRSREQQPARFRSHARNRMERLHCTGLTRERRSRTVSIASPSRCGDSMR